MPWRTNGWQAASGGRSTYRQVRERVRDAALGLAATGLRPGEFAAVWSRKPLGGHDRRLRG